MKVQLRRGASAAAVLSAGLALALLQPLTAGSSVHTPISCNGQIVKIFDNTNGDRVVNGGTPPSFTTNGAYCLTSIGTYHWNNGKGEPPGTLSLAGSEGTVGPFAAKGSAGQGGAPNVNWLAQVPTSPTPAVISGTYTCRDSSPSTWSANSAGGPGFCVVYGIVAQGATSPTTSAPTTTATTTATTHAPPPPPPPSSSLELRTAYALLDSHIQQAISELGQGALQGDALTRELDRLAEEQENILRNDFTFPAKWANCRLGVILEGSVQADAAFDIVRDVAARGNDPGTRVQVGLLTAALALSKVEEAAHACHELSASAREGFGILEEHTSALAKIYEKGAGPGRSDTLLVETVGKLEGLKHDLLEKLPPGDGVPFDFIERETVKELDLMHSAIGASAATAKDLLKQAARHKDAVYNALKKAAR